MKYNREIKNQDIYFTKYISKSVKMRKRKINKSVIFILFSMIILITHVIYILFRLHAGFTGPKFYFEIII